MTTRRALRALPPLLLALAACLSPGGHAGVALAQDDPSIVVAVLVEQTPWTTAKDPVVTLTIKARNDGAEAIADLSYGVTIGQPIRSREQYAASLEDGPGSSLIYAEQFPKKGELAPGEERIFSVDLDMTDLAIDTIDSSVYPAQLDLRRGGVQVVSLNTALIHLTQSPQEPLLLAWWADVEAAPAFAPDGRLADLSLERSVLVKGPLRLQVESIQRILGDPDRETAIDLVVQPSLLRDLRRMQQGYERTDGTTVEASEPGPRGAAAVLSALSAIARSTGAEVVTTPYSAPQLPAISVAGLGRDLDPQFALGRRVAEGQIGAEPDPRVARASRDALDENAAIRLAGRGADTILVGAATALRPEQVNAFAPPPVGDLAVGATDVRLITPDAGTQAILELPALRADPIRAAQVVLGDLATIWREAPVPGPQPDGSDTVRGVAVSLGAGLPAGIWGPITRRLADAPFLGTVPATRLADEVSPTSGEATLVPSPTFSRSFVDQIKLARRRAEATRSMLPTDSALPDAWRENLFLAEAGVYVGNEPAGQPWIDEVMRGTEEVFETASPDTSQVFTLTSLEGTIPLLMEDPGDTPLTVELQFRSSRFRFPEGDRMTVEISAPNQVVEVPVEAAGSGPATIQVITRAPSGLPISQQEMVVRVTAVNRMALILTLGAALVLAALWSRRLFRRWR